MRSVEVYPAVRPFLGSLLIYCVLLELYDVAKKKKANSGNTRFNYVPMSALLSVERLMNLLFIQKFPRLLRMFCHHHRKIIIPQALEKIFNFKSREYCYLMRSDILCAGMRWLVR